jgi:hypothetical protein
MVLKSLPTIGATVAICGRVKLAAIRDLESSRST